MRIGAAGDLYCDPAPIVEVGKTIRERAMKGGSIMKLGTLELLTILGIVLLVFGPTQLPKLAKMLGKSVKTFREGVEGDKFTADKESGHGEEKED